MILCTIWSIYVFHIKHQKYINISQIRANDDSRIIYEKQASQSEIQYDNSNLVLIQEHDKRYFRVSTTHRQSIQIFIMSIKTLI